MGCVIRELHIYYPRRLRWSDWAENDEGITGDELLDFVNNTLLKHLSIGSSLKKATPKHYW